MFKEQVNDEGRKADGNGMNKRELPFCILIDASIPCIRIMGCCAATGA